MVVMELLDQQFPVLEVIVDTEVPCLIDVAYQPGFVIHRTNPVGFWDENKWKQNIFIQI